MRTPPLKVVARGGTALALSTGLALAAGLGLAACGSGNGASSSTTSSTLPPLPPSVLAYVALAGKGSNLGFGNHVATVNVTPGNHSLGKHVPVGTYPDAIAIDGNTAYVANYTSNDVTAIDLATDSAIKSIPVGVGPAGIAISKQLDRAYVTDNGTASSLGSSVTPINLKTMKAMAPISVGAGPQGIAITPDGMHAYVANAGAIVAGQQGAVGNTVTPINLADDKPGKTITVGNGPVGVAVTPDGGTVYVTNLDSLSVTPINVSSNQALAAIPVPGGPIAVAVAGGNAWVVDTPSNTSPGDNVVPIRLSTDRVGAPIKLKKGAQAIAITPNGATAWVACFDSELIQSVNLRSHKAGGTIHVSGGPDAIAITSQRAGAAAGSGGSGSSGTPGTPTTSKKKKHHS